MTINAILYCGLAPMPKSDILGLARQMHNGSTMLFVKYDRRLWYKEPESLSECSTKKYTHDRIPMVIFFMKYKLARLISPREKTVSKPNILYRSS